jgi:PAS domain S-box-containing protein
MAVQKYDVRKPDSEGGCFEDKYWSPVNVPILGRDGNIQLIIHCVEDITEYVKSKHQEANYGQLTELLKGRAVQMESEILRRGQKLQEANELLRTTEQRFGALVNAVREYGIYILSPDGMITSWNQGAERITGYSSSDIMGRHFSVLYPFLPEGLDEKWHQELQLAVTNGQFEEEAWRVKKDGTQFWARVTLSPIYDSSKKAVGYAKVIQDLSERKKKDEELRKLTEELQAQTAALKAVNQELEAFSYSVSHDLRAPLRGIIGFSRALITDYASKLDEEAKDYLGRIDRAAAKMGELIDGLLNLSRMSRKMISKEPVHLSTLAENILFELRKADPDRKSELVIEKGLVAEGDSQLLHVVLVNLLENAWKFSRKTPVTRIEVGKSEKDGRVAYYVRDNGAGFDMRYADKLFGAFQRLHNVSEFEGTGIGLATVKRIIHRHGGEIWAESQLGAGTVFYFSV